MAKGGRRKMTETFELACQIFWLVFALVGAAFALALVWSLYVEKKKHKEENGEEEMKR